MVAGRLMMAAPSVGKVVQGSGVVRDCSGELRSGRACGVIGASRSAGGARVREGGEELRGAASQLRCATTASCAAYGGHEAGLGRSSGGSGVAQRPCGDNLGVDCKSRFCGKWLAPRARGHTLLFVAQSFFSSRLWSGLRTPGTQVCRCPGDLWWVPSFRAPSNCPR